MFDPRLQEGSSYLNRTISNDLNRTFPIYDEPEKQDGNLPSYGEPPFIQKANFMWEREVLIYMF